MLRRKLQDESGAALIFVLLILALLTIVGLSGATTTELELRIAGNEKAHQQAFYFADSGNEVGKMLLERGIEERGWNDAAGDSVVLNKVVVTDKAFYLAPELGDRLPDVANRDATVDLGSGTAALIFGANSRLSAGGAVQMLSGYEGKGKGAAGGGAWIIYDLRSQYDGPNHSSARVHSQWLHVM